MKMRKTYTILRNRKGEVDAVRNGWSWLAFLFSFVWVFAKGLNGWEVIVMALFVLLGLLWWTKLLMPETIILICLIILGLMGYRGNVLKTNNTQRSHRHFRIIHYFTCDSISSVMLMEHSISCMRKSECNCFLFDDFYYTVGHLTQHIRYSSP